MERLYCYAVIKHPTEEDRKKGERSEVIVPVSDWFLAKSEDAVMMMAAKAIPEEHMVDADRVEVAVCPF